MKQHITKEQLNELNDKQKEELFGWYHQSKGIKCFRVGTHMDMHDVAPEKMAVSSDKFNIGQMIEFLDDNNYWKINKSVLNLGMIPRETICNELWEAVKEVLGE